MTIKTCKHCGERFNLHSQRKQQVGGYIDECPDCVEELETETKEVIRAFTTGDGKMACIQILKFEDKEQATLYKKGWDQWSGWNNRRSGSIHDVRFTKIGENSGNSNHKGKS